MKKKTTIFKTYRRGKQLPMPIEIKNKRSNLHLAHPPSVYFTKKDRIGLSPIPGYTKRFLESGISQKEIAAFLTQIQEGERIKIGHELHDGVGPLLAVAMLYMDAIAGKTDKDKIAKEQVRMTILSAIENIRSVSSQLVVSQNIETSLVQLLADFVKRIQDIRSFKIVFSHCDENKLAGMDSQMKIAFYRIVQEQLNNIIKHSKATRVKIKISSCKGVISLSILDDGVGFNTRKPVKGIGLANMAMRLKQFNGEMKIISSPGKGCILEIRLPME